MIEPHFVRETKSRLFLASILSAIGPFLRPPVAFRPAFSSLPKISGQLRATGAGTTLLPSAYSLLSPRLQASVSRGTAALGSHNLNR